LQGKSPKETRKDSSTVCVAEGPAGRGGREGGILKDLKLEKEEAQLQKKKTSSPSGKKGEGQKSENEASLNYSLQGGGGEEKPRRSAGK